MAERCWLDPSGFVYVSLGEGRGGAAGSSCPLPTQPACPVPGGQGVLAQLLFACTNARLFASLPPSISACLSLLTRQVWPGRGVGGPGWGSGCLSLPVSSPTLFPMALSAPLLLHSCAHPHRLVAHLHSSSKRLLSAFVCSAMSFCVMLLALVLPFRFGRLLLSLLPSSYHKGSKAWLRPLRALFLVPWPGTPSLIPSPRTHPSGFMALCSL